MPDGAPISWKVLEPGAPVRSRDGQEVGKVSHVLGDPDADIFDGLVVRVDHGHRFVDATQVASIYEDGVVLGLDARECDQLPEPSANPPALAVDPDDVARGDLERKLRRAWDLISGRY